MSLRLHLCPGPPVPRDVSSVELLLKYHQGIKAEINTRAKNFSTCLELGESLLQRQHQASDEVSPSLSLSPFLLAKQLQGAQRGGGDASKELRCLQARNRSHRSLSSALGRWMLTEGEQACTYPVPTCPRTSELSTPLHRWDTSQVPQKDEVLTPKPHTAEQRLESRTV